jgi:hypothetical protein
MNIKTLAKKTLAVAMLSGFAVAANAATTPLGAAAVGTPLSFNAIVMPAGPFNDIFTFTLPNNGGTGYSVINFPVGTLFNTALTTITLFSNADGNLFNADDTQLASAVSNNNANGSSGGLYNGAISVTAVPEPESYAMLLAGLGVMGAIAMRRNKRKTY